MRKKIVIDTGVFVNYFLKKNEKYRKAMSEIIASGSGLTLYLNITELYYILGRLLDKESASVAISLIKNSSIKIVNIDEKLSISAGDLKLSYDFLSIVDCYVIALAEGERAMIYTVDSSIEKVYKDTVVIK
ncbi:hypothetical protein L3N51_02286 [Metallosphaera sp. J1]|uniref:PIN domain-containing protein n=1 Tax=Metallosphaera TaxID=41980 RepID=UPI001EE056AE|nr:PIN domain-containing protein [Metallosphaera javensis (ex Hofmann et al. 2022)]MCG3109989.1 hypothetical protein [Metallosphaera javensis (ex Hofmann et al. 2022)]BCS93731.1 MAG: PIN domain nuclease [Metallosphaera javensis (ex Sakai et al. 2022)]